MNIQYDKKPEFDKFKGNKEDAFDWITGVEIKATSVGWEDVLFGSNPLEELAGNASQARRTEYATAFARRKQLAADCMAALYISTSGAARDCIKFTKDPAEAWRVLKRKYSSTNIGTLYMKLLEVVVEGMKGLGDEYVTKFKECELRLNQFRANHNQEALEQDLVCSLFVMGLLVPEYSAVKSMWTLKKETDSITLDYLEIQVLNRRHEIEQENTSSHSILLARTDKSNTAYYSNDSDNDSHGSNRNSDARRSMSHSEKRLASKEAEMERERQREIDKYSKKPRVSFDETCSICRKVGHSAHNCYFRNK